MTYLLAMGGCSDAVSDRIDRYDPAADRWTCVGKLGFARFSLAAAVLDGRIYACGGLDYEADPAVTVEQSDLTGKEWATDARLNAPRYFHAAVSLGGKLYVLGGCSADREPSIDVFEPADAADPASEGRWVPAGELSVPVAPAFATVIDGRVWIAGEVEFTQWELWSGELPGGPWTREAAFSLDRRFPAVCAFDGAFYFCGGVTGDPEGEQTASARVERFDLASRALQALPDLPTARHGGTAIGADGRVYVIGGYELSSSDGMPVVEAFELAAQTWRSLEPLEVGRYGICALAIPG